MARKKQAVTQSPGAPVAPEKTAAKLYTWTLLPPDELNEDACVELVLLGTPDELAAAGLDLANPGTYGRQDVALLLEDRASLTAAEVAMWEEGLKLFDAATPAVEAEGQFCGAWSATAIYQPGALVMHRGQRWIAQRATKVNLQPGMSGVWLPHDAPLPPAVSVFSSEQAPTPQAGAPAAGPPAATLSELLAIPLKQIIPTPDNPRVIAFDDPALAELASSIQSHGQVQPALVRPHPTEAGYYDLRCGHRRFAACELAGVPTLLCLVRALTDQQAYEATVTENLQRENLSPLEEGRAVAGLLAHGWDQATVAAHIGKSVDWVARRAKLADLSPAWQAAIAAPAQPEDPENRWFEPPFAACRLPAAALELIARYDLPQQAELLQQLTGERVQPSTADLRELVGKLQHQLTAAPWDLADAMLVKAAGACVKCPKRSGCQAVLFPDLAAADHCLDAPCWARKLAAHTTQQELLLREKHANLVLITERYDLPRPGKDDLSDEGDETDDDGHALPPPRAGVIPRRAYNEARKGQRGAVPALQVDGPQAGTLTWVMLHATGNGGRGGGAAGTAIPKTLAERRADLEAKRAQHVLQALRKRLKEPAKGAPYVVPPPIALLSNRGPQAVPAALMNLALALGIEPYTDDHPQIKPLNAGGKVKHQYGPWGMYDVLLQHASLNQANALLWGAIARKLLAQLQTSTNGDAPRKLPVAERVAALLGESLQELQATAIAECPEPKAWKNLKADGTPKATKAPAGKPAAGKDGDDDEV